jgi:hypothetical protein
MLAIRKLMQVAGDPVFQLVCPSCGSTLRLSRITPGTHSLRDQHTYSCRPCGVWMTEAADTATRAPEIAQPENVVLIGVQRVVMRMQSPEPLQHRVNPGTKRCYLCDGSFGLIRHRFALKQFCSKQCLDQYRGNIESQASRSKQWIDFLTRNNESGFSSPPGARGHRVA